MFSTDDYAGPPLRRIVTFISLACFFSRFGLKQGINFDYFGLKQGMVCAV